MDIKDYGGFCGTTAEKSNQTVTTRSTFTHGTGCATDDQRVHVEIFAHGCHTVTSFAIFSLLDNDCTSHINVENFDSSVRWH